jgi:hypothetical protein
VVVMAMAEPAAQLSRGVFVPYGRWTAQWALTVLPETPEALIEVFNGSLLLSPRPSTRHQRVLRELTFRLHRAARSAGFEALPEINLVLGENLAIPDIVVVSNPGEDHVWVNADDVVLAVEIVSPGSKRHDTVVRPGAYAEAGIGHFMRVEFPESGPMITLHELVKDVYQPIVMTPAGTTFVMREPFPFEIDPAELVER